MNAIRMVNRYFQKRRRTKSMKGRSERIQRLEQVGTEWAKAGAIALPGVQWEVRDETESEAYLVEDGVMHHRDRRHVRYSTPITSAEA
jgi:hypothetical protein